MEAAIQSGLALFREKFGQDPTIGCAAPGRVNLIGEHIDYCDGFVFPMAIEQCTVIFGKPNNSDSFNIVTASSIPGESQTLTIPKDLSTLSPDDGHHWGNYVKGVLHGFAANPPQPCDIAIATSVPLGGGLSSSAALEVAVYTFAQAALGIAIENTKEKALACQKAEHTFAHVPCGVMDQFISTLALKDHAMLLDCKSFEVKHVPIKDEVTIVVTNSNVKHELVDGEYAKRRTACEEVLKVVKAHNPSIVTWRDVRSIDLLAVQSQLSDEYFRRGRHVVSELERTSAAFEAFQKCDYEQFGKIMIAGHKSLKDDYNVTVPETDKIVELATEVRGVYGARMTGGGFGGCVVSLVRTAAVPKLIAHLKRDYPAGTSFATRPAEGAHVLDLAAILAPPKPKRQKKSSEKAEQKTEEKKSDSTTTAPAPTAAS